MDVISFCIIPGKKAAVFKDILLSTLHLTYSILQGTRTERKLLFNQSFYFNGYI